MPNCGYRSNDYMRCSQCNKQNVTAKTLAMAYVPWQEFQNLYPAEKGFCRGTIFEDLDKPFLGKGGCHK